MFGKDKNSEELISPVIFHEPGEDFSSSPMSYIEQDVNTPTKYAINRMTLGGKYVRGGMLYFSFNGVEIYTDIDNVIFVNEDTHTLFIRESKNIQGEISPSNPESRQYIMLYTDLGYDEVGNENEFPLRWEAVTGRREAYDNIKNNAPVIDIDKSLVLVENVTLKDSLTVREFMNYLKNSDIINEESFDINDYAGADYI